MLDVNDLVTTYGKIEALKGVTLHAGRGRITCLLGPNGAGKTTPVNWISSQAGMSDFLNSARRLSKAITRGQQLDKAFGSVRAPEPPLDLALSWTRGKNDASFSRRMTADDHQQPILTIV